MAAVALDGLQMVFPGGAVAVDNLTLDIEHGEFMVLLGPSGSGKTTLLRLVAGLEQPTSGHVYLDGQLVDRLSPRHRNVAMVFQDFALYPHLTAGQNIAFPLRTAQVEDVVAAAQVRDAAVRLGIDDVLDRLPHQLSGGEQQRVALARAAVRRPTVLLLDEPLSGVDPHLRLEMCEQIHDLNSAMGVTTIYVTHARSEALALADRVAVLRHGRLQQVGTPHQVYDDPATLFVASLLIRDANLVQGAVYAEGGGAVIDLGRQAFHIGATEPGAALLAAHHTERVTVVIRTDALTPVDSAGSDGNVLLGVVRRVCDVGAEVVVEMDTGAVPIVPETEDRDIDGARPDLASIRRAKAAAAERRKPPGRLRRALARLATPAAWGSVTPPRLRTARTTYGFYPTYEPTGEAPDTTADLVLRLPHDVAVRPQAGETLTVAVDLSRVYLFDGTGARIRLTGNDGVWGRNHHH